MAYEQELIPSLVKCFELIEQSKVSLRGWDYPHLSRRDSERAHGNNWVASWSDFWGHNEYWRLYQSGQFVHLFSVREATEPEWRKQLEALARSHLGWGELKDFDWSSVPGFVSIVNFIYTVTEIYELAARLCEKGVYRGVLTISIELRGIKGFLLMAEWNRAWHNRYAATEDMLRRRRELQSDILVASSAQEALNTIIWFFERFGWMNPPVEVLRADQGNFLRRRI
jgi:hypothetical protein